MRAKRKAAAFDRRNRHQLLLHDNDGVVDEQQSGAMPQAKAAHGVPLPHLMTHFVCVELRSTDILSDATAESSTCAATSLLKGAASHTV